MCWRTRVLGFSVSSWGSCGEGDCRGWFPSWGDRGVVIERCDTCHSGTDVTDEHAEQRAALFILESMREAVDAADREFALDAAPALLSTETGREALIAALESLQTPTVASPGGD